MRTNPAGAVASGDTNVRPSSETSWKNTSVSNASRTAAQGVVSVKPRGCFAGSARRLGLGFTGSRRSEAPPDLGHHALAERAPIVRSEEHTSELQSRLH